MEVSPPVPAAERGSGLVLTCRASGCLNPPTITWRRTDQDQTVLQRTQKQDGLSLLHLQDLDLQDQGGYSCEANCDSVNRTRNTQIHVLCESETPRHLRHLRSGLYYIITNLQYLYTVAQRGQDAVSSEMKNEK